ncbi:Hypothetical_protein [Hexamita inflata]|uniref:Hypothetical_protein n=1 Tax=Hexamita inflata TaxID=28002 RepID=A0AA86TPL2_9EUKA|nr:Hypothetical protein HINF_LOCUS9782 [Hexamita inflata]CAI9978060.1 Hypothetical protein HINF_LOCUS65705 [Hexamita inflata]
MNEYNTQQLYAFVNKDGLEVVLTEAAGTQRELFLISQYLKAELMVQQGRVRISPTTLRYTHTTTLARISRRKVFLEPMLAVQRVNSLQMIYHQYFQIACIATNFLDSSYIRSVNQYT